MSAREYLERWQSQFRDREIDRMPFSDCMTDFAEAYHKHKTEEREVQTEEIAKVSWRGGEYPLNMWCVKSAARI